MKNKGRGKKRASTEPSSSTPKLSSQTIDEDTTTSFSSVSFTQNSTGKFVPNFSKKAKTTSKVATQVPIVGVTPQSPCSSNDVFKCLSQPVKSSSSLSTNVHHINSEFSLREQCDELLTPQAKHDETRQSEEKEIYVPPTTHTTGSSTNPSTINEEESNIETNNGKNSKPILMKQPLANNDTELAVEPPMQSPCVDDGVNDSNACTCTSKNDEPQYLSPINTSVETSGSSPQNNKDNNKPKQNEGHASSNEVNKDDEEKELTEQSGADSQLNEETIVNIEIKQVEVMERPPVHTCMSPDEGCSHDDNHHSNDNISTSTSLTNEDCIFGKQIPHAAAAASHLNPPTLINESALIHNTQKSMPLSLEDHMMTTVGADGIGEIALQQLNDSLTLQDIDDMYLDLDDFNTFPDKPANIRATTVHTVDQNVMVSRQDVGKGFYSSLDDSYNLIDSKRGPLYSTGGITGVSGPILTDNQPMHDQTKLLEGLVTELSMLNQQLIKFKQNMKFTGNQRNQVKNNTYMYTRM